MKSKWFKTILILMTLTLCMGVMCLPAYAVEGVEEAETLSEYDETQAGMDDAEIAEPEIVINTETGEDILIEPDGTPILASMAGEGTGFRPFTPPGTGTVVDNAIDSDGKEFYTIKTEDGSVFYLIIDRQRNAQNVYFLNAVTEDDLMALAQKNNKTVSNGASADKPADQPGADSKNPAATPEPEAPKTSNNNAMYILIVIVAAGIGGAAYYFKIVKGKNVTDDFDDEDDGGNEYDYDELDSSDDEYEEGRESDE